MGHLGDTNLASQIASEIPADSLALQDLAVVVSELAVEEARLGPPGPESLSNLALALGNLSARLGAVGRFDEAVTTAQEAVDRMREIQPADSKGNLAFQLVQLASGLNAVGRHQGAVAAAEEAAKLLREATASGAIDRTWELALVLDQSSAYLALGGTPD